MNPVIIIPTYISARRGKSSTSLIATYDHATGIAQRGELERCLESIDKAQGDVPVIILVAAESSVEQKAAAKVQASASKFPGVQTLVIAAPEAKLVAQRMEQLNLGAIANGVALEGYSAIRNLGLVVANVFGFDAVVFIDDDEIIEDTEFLSKAVYGLGKLTKKGIPIIAKTGYFIDAKGSFQAREKDAWYDRYWTQNKEFNKWMTKAMAGPRLSRSNHVCGGCMALHKEAFRRLAFDPWIPRGEDLDYLLNLRMYGSEMWFDNKWCLRHLPPATSSEGIRFKQDVYRWMYENRKLEYSRTQIDLLQIKPQALEPYPGPFLEPGVRRRIRLTAKLRSIASKDRKEYGRAVKAARSEADEYASQNCAKYFEFQYAWPDLMARLENDAVLRTALVQSTMLRKGIDLREQQPNPAGAPGAQQAAANVAAAAGAAADAVAGAAGAAGAGVAAAASSPDIQAKLAAAQQAQMQNAQRHGLSPREFDPGLTCEIRLNIED